jgi:N-carbamoyl-L-amino-acid hydrolase
MPVGLGGWGMTDGDARGDADEDEDADARSDGAGVGIDAERFRERFEAYAAVGATDDGGLHRLACTAADGEARDRFVADCEALGLDVRVDRVGNVFARREGRDPDADPVLVGSHLDSQPYGGRYDGQLGVLAGLEALSAFEDAGLVTDRPVELVNWTNEEGTRFEHAMLGSGVFAGVTGVEEALALTDAEGVTLEAALRDVGYDGDEVDLAPGDVHAHVELHVEQGPTLDEHGTSVGVVEGAFGVAWLRAVLEGESDHAGPTPMHARRDALAAAADAVSAVGRLPGRLSADAVATVGELGVEPGSVNVVPSRAEFTIDLRSYDDAVVDRAIERARAEVAAACDRHGVSVDLRETWRTPHSEFDADVRATLAAAAAARGVDHERVVSGAGHDAVYVNRVAPTGMLFVPSVDGVTHNEREFTAWDDCVAGAEVLAEATRRLATVA